jgi:hypothetical protein
LKSASVQGVIADDLEFGGGHFLSNQSSAFRFGKISEKSSAPNCAGKCLTANRFLPALPSSSISASAFDLNNYTRACADFLREARYKLAPEETGAGREGEVQNGV